MLRHSVGFKGLKMADFTYGSLRPVALAAAVASLLAGCATQRPMALKAERSVPVAPSTQTSSASTGSLASATATRSNAADALRDASDATSIAKSAQPQAAQPNESAAAHIAGTGTASTVDGNTAQAWFDVAPASPSPGDLRAVQVSYPTGRFEPAWLIESAREARAVETRLPDGALRTQAKQAGQINAFPADAFTPLGPMPLNAGASAASGRVNVVVSDPVDPTIAYFGSDGGGVWKTTNCCSAETTWTVKTDLPEIASIAIGDVTLDPKDHNTIYAGTGDLRFGSFSFGAAGLLKSTDAGETWSLLGLDVFNPFYGPSATLGYPQYQAIGKVVVDPNNSSNLIVGTKTGLFLSYDAGLNWTGPCLTNPHETQRQDTTGLIASTAGDSTVLLAAIGTRGSPTAVQPDLNQNGANGVYRAFMPTIGCPVGWTLLDDNWPANTGNGVAGATSNGRIEIAVAPTDSGVVYAQVSDTNLGNGIVGVWKSVNGGGNWTQVGSASAYSPSEGTQMWYDAGLTVSPVDANVVISSALNLFRTTNGGASFGRIGGGNMHVDHHARAFVGGDPDVLLAGSDGGMWLSTNATATSPSFITLNNSINTIEFYSGDITADFAKASFRGISGGAQDNGSNTATWSGVAPGPSAWTTRLGGDGIYTRIEPVLGQRWYYSSQNGNLRVALAGPGGNPLNAAATGPWGGDRLSFVMPVELYRYGELDAPASGCTSVAGCGRMLGGTNRVWETITGAVPASSWYANSPDLTKGTLNDRSFVNQLAHAVSDPSVAIAGTNDGNVWMGFGLGQGTANTANWVNVTASNQVLPNRPIMDVATDPLDPRIGYAAVGGFNQNTPAQPGHLFQLVCTGDCSTFTWTDKTGNLPNIPANSVIANPLLPAQVFAGTDWGLYFTNDINAAAPVWFRHEGIPHAMIWDMAIDRGFTTLAVFTRSRGAWVSPLPTAADLDTLFADGFE